MSEGYVYRVTPEGHGPDGAPWRWEVRDRGTSEWIAGDLAGSRLEAIGQAQAAVAAQVTP